MVCSTNAYLFNNDALAVGALGAVRGFDEFSSFVFFMKLHDVLSLLQ